MVLFSIRMISKDDRALINVLRREKNWSSQRSLRKFPGKNWAWTSVDRLLKKINSTGVTERPKGSNRPRSVCTSEFRKKIELVEELICSHESALHIYKNPYELQRETGISRSSVRRIVKHDLRLL